jgi:hypothetical protein
VSNGGQHSPRWQQETTDRTPPGPQDWLWVRSIGATSLSHATGTGLATNCGEDKTVINVAMDGVAQEAQTDELFIDLISRSGRWNEGLHQSAKASAARWRSSGCFGAP